MRANHNLLLILIFVLIAVSNGSKILKWEQITTGQHYSKINRGCFQWFKDTKMRANHNHTVMDYLTIIAVSNGSKILKWEQITTVCMSL